MRWAVVGCCGAGKSTLAAKVAAAAGVEHIELDAIFHQANWEPIGREEFRAVLSEKLVSPGWVTCGNYNSKVGDLIWEHADRIVWLDLPKPLVMRRLIWRTIRRGVTRKELWNGNRESFRQIFKRDPEENIVMWGWTQFDSYRTGYLAKMLKPGGPQVIRLTTPDEVATFLEATRLACRRSEPSPASA